MGYQMKVGRVAERAMVLMAAGAVFLDTETTGLGDRDQIIEVGIVDVRGGVLMNRRSLPTVAIDPQAQDVHGIDVADLVRAPAWGAVYREMLDCIDGRPVVMYNAPFDDRLVRQSCNAHDIDISDWDRLERHCAMQLAIDLFGADGRDRLPLVEAMAHAGISLAGTAHQALIDALNTRNLVAALAAAGSSVARKAA